MPDAAEEIESGFSSDPDPMVLATRPLLVRMGHQFPNFQPRFLGITPQALSMGTLLPLSDPRSLLAAPHVLRQPLNMGKEGWS